MEKSSSRNSIEGSDMDDPPSLMDMYAKQIGMTKDVSDTWSESPPPHTSHDQQPVYHDDPSIPSQQETEQVVTTSDKTGLISQNEAGNKLKGSSRFFNSLSKVALSAKSMVGKIAASSSSSSSASAYFNPNAPIALANLSGE